MDFIFFLTVLLAVPRVVVLSVWMGDCGCCHPILMRDWQRGDNFFGTDEESGELGSSSKRRDKFDDLCNGEDGSIFRRDGVVF